MTACQDLFVQSSFPWASSPHTEVIIQNHSITILIDNSKQHSLIWLHGESRGQPTVQLKPELRIAVASGEGGGVGIGLSCSLKNTIKLEKWLGQGKVSVCGGIRTFHVWPSRNTQYLQQWAEISWPPPRQANNGGSLVPEPRTAGRGVMLKLPHCPLPVLLGTCRPHRGHPALSWLIDWNYKFYRFSGEEITCNWLMPLKPVSNSPVSTSPSVRQILLCNVTFPISQFLSPRPLQLSLQVGPEKMGPIKWCHMVEHSKRIYHSNPSPQ